MISPIIYRYSTSRIVNMIAQEIVNGHRNDVIEGRFEGLIEMAVGIKDLFDDEWSKNQLDTYLDNRLLERILGSMPTKLEDLLFKLVTAA